MNFLHDWQLWLRLQLCFAIALGWCGFAVAAEPESALNTDVSLSATGWRLNSAGQYQLLSENERTDYRAQRPSFCQSPRPDRFAAALPNITSNQQPLQLSNEHGVLRWWSASISPQMIWPYGSPVPQGAGQLPELISNQMALIVQPQQPEQLQVVWPEPELQRYSAVDLSDPLLPKALWQWQAPIMGAVQTPVAATFKTTTGPMTVILTVSGEGAAQPAFWLLDGSTGQLIATQLYSGIKKTVELPFVLQALSAAPVVLDRNADGYTDRIYLVDIQGRVVQVDVNEQLQFHSRVVADLSDAAAQFNVQVVASRSILPDAERFALGGSSTQLDPGGAVRSQHMPDTVGSVGQPADIVVLVSTKKDQSQLWVLTIPDAPAFTIQPHHLTKRDLTADEADIIKETMPTIPTGWYGTLPAPPVSLPQIFAGVLYVPVAASAVDCAGARQATQLIARHVFQGSQVYSQEVLAAIPKPFGAPTAVQRSSGELALQDLQSGALLLPQLRGIRPDCRYCTTPLHQHDYPKWQRMSIYQHESEIYR